MDLCGHYAFVAISADDPDLLVAARKECPLIVGVGEGESFVASAIPAFLRETRRVPLVGDDEGGAISAPRAQFLDAGSGAIPAPQGPQNGWDDETARTGGQ